MTPEVLIRHDRLCVRNYALALNEGRALRRSWSNHRSGVRVCTSGTPVMRYKVSDLPGEPWELNVPVNLLGVAGIANPWAPAHNKHSVQGSHSDHLGDDEAWDLIERCAVQVLFEDGFRNIALVLTESIRAVHLGTADACVASYVVRSERMSCSTTLQDRRISFYEDEPRRKGVEWLWDALQREVAYLHAPQGAPVAGEYPVIFLPKAAGVLLHEVLGHSLEADSTCLIPIGHDFGVSFSLRDDGSLRDNAGYCPVDDELVPSVGTELVSNGVVINHMHDRRSADKAMQRPTGNSRSADHRSIPGIQQTNLVLRGGTMPFEQLLDVPRGLLVDDCVDGRAGQRFALGTRRAWNVVHGRVEGAVSSALISGEPLQAVAALDVAHDEDCQTFSGMCGKRSQSALPVGLKSPALRVRRLQVC